MKGRGRPETTGAEDGVGANRLTGSQGPKVARQSPRAAVPSSCVDVDQELVWDYGATYGPRDRSLK